MASPFVGVMNSNWVEGRGKFAEDVFGGLIDLIAKSSVAVHYFDIKVDVAAWGMRMLGLGCFG